MSGHPILYIFLVFTVVIYSRNAPTKVQPPNYDFSLDTLVNFYPEKELKDIKAKFGPGKIMNVYGDVQQIRFEVEHIRYKFPVIVQVFKGKVLDFYARLPGYFLHDVFHQSIINRIGNQNQYFVKEGNAIYMWNKVNNSKHIYSSSCSITCYPIFYSAITTNIPPELPTYTPILEKLAPLF